MRIFFALVGALFMLLSNLISVKAQVIAAGETHTLILCSDGVYGTGENYVGELGDSLLERNYFQKIKSSLKIKKISTNWVHSLILTEDSSVYAFGYGYDGQLGNGLKQARNTVPKKMIIDKKVVDISAGINYSLVLTADSLVYSCGDNFYGKLGIGFGRTADTLTKVFKLNKVVGIAAGHHHSLALKSDGTVWGWGSNFCGQLGDSSIVNKSTPVKVKGISNVVSIAVGNGFSVAIKNDGSVWTWGNNTYGQLGQANLTIQLVPAKIAVLENIESISAKGWHVLAKSTNGDLYAWGLNTLGQIGGNSYANQKTPLKILTNVRFIETGHYSSFAIKNDNSLWSWGCSSSGQLGDSANQNRYIPTANKPFCVFSFPSLSVSFDGFDPVCIQDNSFLLSGAKPSGGVYSGTGVSGGRFFPFVAGTGDHWIKYSVSAGGSFGLDSSLIQVRNCLGINSAKDDQIVISPNPSNGKIRIQHPEKESIVVVIVNILGETILHKEISQNSDSWLDFAEHPDGIYFVKIYANGLETVRKIKKG